MLFTDEELRLIAAKHGLDRTALPAMKQLLRMAGGGFTVNLEAALKDAQKEILRETNYEVSP